MTKIGAEPDRENQNVRGVLRIGILASGKGSNLKAIIDAIECGKVLNARVGLVISNNSDAGALEIARSAAIPAVHLSRKQFDSDIDFEQALLLTLREHGIGLVALAGYMKKIAPSIIREFRDRIINIHPALLPSFGGPGMYGMFVHEAVIRSGTPMSGATVHVVDEEYDHGRILIQKTVAISPGETPESLAAKIAVIEHEIYPEAIRLFAEGDMTASGVHAAAGRGA